MDSYYAARAAEYDLVYSKPERQADLRLIEQWLVQKFNGRRVIEVACGTGYWTRFIASVARSVLAVDSTPETLAIARKRVAGPARFLEDDAYSFSHVQGQFDAAFAGFWFSHIPISRRREFLLKLGGVLQPCSRVVSLDNLFVQGSSTPISRTDSQSNTFQTRQLEDGSSYEVIKNFPSSDELIDLVEEFGVNARVTCWSYYWILEFDWK